MVNPLDPGIALDKQNISPHNEKSHRHRRSARYERAEHMGTKRNSFSENRGFTTNEPVGISYKSRCTIITQSCT